MEEKRPLTRKEKIEKEKDTISMLLYALYGLFLLLTLLIIGKIIHIQTRYSVDPRVVHLFHPTNTKVIDEPSRGAIIACDGRLLALSTPLYQVYMDCAVRKDAFAADKDGADKEREWQEKAAALAEGLARIYPERSAQAWRKLILDGRRDNKRYVRIGGRIDHETLQRVKALPLFSEGANKGGLQVEKIDTRQYPYGTLARRTIGYVKDNSRSNGNSRIGIEGKFDYELHGREGYEWLRTTDSRRRVHNYDSLTVAAVDGMDVRTTLNIDFQDIADRALRRQIQDEPKIQGAVCIIMETATGAIRAMVNLQRDTLPGSDFQERINLALGQVGEQGSVFKTVTLMSLLEDGHVKSLQQTLPTNRGAVSGGYRIDNHILDYERQTGRRDITVKHGFEISSNYVFTYLATKYYGSHPQDFFDRIYSYKLGERFDFDIDGLGTPQVTDPRSPGWSRTTLGTTAYGYSIAVTPLHVAAFYNAIANKGRMMKPYLVESIEQYGVVKKKYGPVLLNSICSRATADTLIRALMAVTEEGTGKRLRQAKLTVAGKTGTAQVALSPAEKPRKGDAYHDIAGRKKNQGTFVGFFPAEAPKYTILVTVYSTLSLTSFYGGTLPALAVGEIVDNIYAIDATWGERLSRKGSLQPMTARNEAMPVGTAPALKGLGLRDALYEIEQAGYRCSYTGTGHVASQSPAPGTALETGKTIQLTLK